VLAAVLLIAAGAADRPVSEWPAWRVEACAFEINRPPHLPVEPDASRFCPPLIRIGAHSLQLVRLAPADGEAAEERAAREHIAQSCPKSAAGCPPVACQVDSARRELIDGQPALELRGTRTRGAAEPAADAAEANQPEVDACGPHEVQRWSWYFVRRPGDGNDWILAEETGESSLPQLVRTLRFRDLAPLTEQQRAAQRDELALATRARDQATRSLQLRERDRRQAQAIERGRAAPPPAHDGDRLVYALLAQATGRFALYTWELATARARLLYQGHANGPPYPLLTCARNACFVAVGQTIQRISAEGAVEPAVPQIVGRPLASDLAASPAGDRVAYLEGESRNVVVHEAPGGRVVARHPWPERDCSAAIEGWSAGDGGGVVLALAHPPGSADEKDARCSQRVLLAEDKGAADAQGPLSPWGVRDGFQPVEPRAIASLPDGKLLLVSYKPVRGVREPQLVVVSRSGAEVAAHPLESPGGADWSKLTFRVVGWLGR
jgi:hypothetical protein